MEKNPELLHYNLQRRKRSSVEHMKYNYMQTYTAWLFYAKYKINNINSDTLLNYNFYIENIINGMLLIINIQYYIVTGKMY